MKVQKLLFALSMGTLMFLSSNSIQAKAADISGQIGQNKQITWTIEKDDKTKETTLLIYGDDTITKEDGTNVPWLQYKNQITKVETEKYSTDNIKCASDADLTNWFNDCPNLKNLDIEYIAFNTNSLNWSNMIKGDTSLSKIKAKSGFVLPKLEREYIWQVGNTVVVPDGKYAIKSNQTVTKRQRYYNINYVTDCDFTSYATRYDILNGLTFEKYGSISNGNKHFAGWYLYKDGEYKYPITNLQTHILANDLENTGITLNAKWDEFGEDDNCLYRGTIFCYDNKTLEWSITKDGVFTLSGNGVVDEQYGKVEDTIPWQQYKDLIKEAYITDNVTIKDVSNLFSNCSNLVKVDISGLNSEIGESATFKNSPNIEYFTAKKDFPIPTTSSDYVWVSNDHIYKGDESNTLLSQSTIQKVKRYYTIHYILNGGDFTGPHNTTYDIYTGLTSNMLATPVLDKYHFDGWYIDEKCTTLFTEVKPFTFEDINVYAKWTHIFNDDHSKGYQPIEGPYEVKPDPRKEDNNLTQKKIVNAKKARISSIKIKKKSNKVKITFKKTKGYSAQIQWSLKKNFKRSRRTRNIEGSKYTISNPQRGGKYYVRIRTYKTINGKKVYGKWSKIKTFKLKTIKKNGINRNGTNSKKV